MLLRQNQKGRSMIEMLGVLGIMAVITVLGITAYTMATKNVKVNNVKAEMATIAQQVRSVSASGDYLEWGNTKDYESAFVDTGLMKEYNGFGKVGASGFGYEVVSADGGESFGIVVLGLTEEECNLLRSQDWSNGEGSFCN
ncbi:MAG: prepilin-type N-terminal cleavage/methylation domain-containing protein [Alphaproteobacteria bacterium]|nr:prepilin-type N-terminal cleavage/methylation domain-containing protein [Alphaproteobacteria bacterium]